MISQSLYLADRTRLWDRQIFRFLTMTFISSHFTFRAVSSSSFEATFRDIRSFLWLVTDSLTSCPKNREIRENNRRHFLHDIDRRTNARMQPEASQRDTIFPKTPSHRSTQPASARVSHPSGYLFLERHPSQSGDDSDSGACVRMNSGDLGEGFPILYGGLWPRFSVSQLV